MKASLLLTILAGSLSLAFSPASAASPDEIRAESNKLMERAKQAKAEGRADEADELARKAKHMQLESREREGGEKRRPEEGKIERAKREVEELRKAGRGDEADHIQRQLAETKKRGPGKGDGAPDRMRHVKQAIEHVRAAGLPDVAEHLEQIARKLQAEGEMRKGGDVSAENEQLKRAIGELQGGMKELHGEVQRLRQALDETRAQAKKSAQ